MISIQSMAISFSLRRAFRWLVPLALLLALAAFFFIAPEGALGKLDAVGYAVCHRIDARSFHVAGRQLPLCARCTGEFNAAALALIFQGFLSGRRSRLPSRSLLGVLVIFFLAFAIDGANSYVYLLKQTPGGALTSLPNLYNPSNTLRLFTGSGMGLAVASILYPVVNQSLWRELDDRPALEWKSFSLLLLITLVIDLLILSEHPLFLYPVAYLSVFGILGLLTSAFAIFWIIFMRQENTFTRIGECWLPASAGLTLGLLLLLGIDLLRYRLTGTWAGFPGIIG